MKFICIYQEGVEDWIGDTRYKGNTYESPEAKYFRSMHELEAWIAEKQLEDETAPITEDGKYVFEWVYTGRAMTGCSFFNG